MKRWAVGAWAVVITALALGFVRLGAQAPAGEWRAHGGDQRSHKYSPLDQIDKTNVGSLQIAWRHPGVDPELRGAFPDLTVSNNFRSTPVMVGGVLYASNAIGLVEAMDPRSGKTLWTQEPLSRGPDGLRGTASRGIAVWQSGPERRLLAVRGEYLFSLDPKTGKPTATFGDGGRVNLRDGLGPLMTRYSWTSAPLVVRDVVIVGGGGSDSPKDKEASPGDVRAYDVRSGKLLWTFHVIPREGEFGIDTWDDGSWKYTGNANVWSLMSADEELGYVYLPFTSPTDDWYGGHRLGNNLFSGSLVCVDARTGTRVWHYQITHHDLWDYDLPTPPILADITVDGRPIKAVVQLTKQAFAYVFDRVTGKPVWPIEERPVPASTAPGEKASPTQPTPTKPPAFDRQGLTVDDLIDFTPELRAEAIEITKSYEIGPIFNPPSLKNDAADGTKGSIFLPGWVGGANWGGGAFDPDTGMLYVPSVTAPYSVGLVKRTPEQGSLLYVYGTHEYVVGPRGLPLTKPPYGRVTAIDLNRGEIKWTVPNGDGPRNHPLLASLHLPPLGQPGRTAPLLTKTLLFVGEGDPVNLATPPGGGGKKFRAFDKTTGAVVWETELPAGTTSAPMTYAVDGKQYVVVAIGGVRYPAEWIAFSLPPQQR
jgi:glucose dehydrogenase